MPRKKKLINNSDLPDHEIEAIQFAVFKNDYLAQHSELLTSKHATYSKELFTFSVNMPVNHPCHSTCKLAADQAALNKIEQRLILLTEELAQAKQTETQKIQYDPATLQIVKKSIKAPSHSQRKNGGQASKGEYSLTVTVPLNEVLFQVYRIKQ